MAGSEHLPGDAASSPTLGSYRLTRRVARGGMGEIWRGVDLRSGADVAVKRLFLDSSHPAFERNRERLIREAAALRRLQHGNVVRYLDAGSDAAGQPFLVLEWLEGESLAQRRRRAPLELELVLHVARQALRGLVACHGRGIVHRDIKPGNLMLVRADELQVKVVDFGLALLNDETTRLTRAGQMLGTLHYLSPEQARGLMVIDGRADLYALGVVLYELVTGRLPFESDQAVALLLKIVTETPPDPQRLRPGLPGWLDRLILRAMSREPVERFGSAEEMLAALEVPEARRGAANLDLPEVITPATGGEVDTLQAPLSVTEEVRLVQLLCLQLSAGEASVGDQLHQALEQHGAVVYRLLGGQIIGVFGLYQTRGDETRRALEAGLAARALAGARVRLLAASVHLEVGQGLRLNAPELDRVAEKLIGLPPGELVLDDQLGSMQPWSLVAEVRRVKGHSAVEALIDDAPVRPVLGEQTPTVGRQTELVALRAALELAEEEQEPEAVVVVGPPGIGKSRLLHELRVDLRRRAALLLEGRTSSTGAETPYALVAGAVRRQCRIRVGHDDPRRLAALEAWVGQLVPGERGEQATRFIGSILGLPVEPHASLELARDDPRLMREQVTRAFETVLGQAAAAGPVCLVLEDLQWADEESLALVARLLERMERTPLVVLATGRPQLLERHPRLFEAVEPTRITLRPLGRRSLRRLLRAVLGQDLPEEAEERVLAWCGGNPYFAEELITWMVGCKALVREGGRWTLRQTPEALQLPVGVEGAIQARLDDLDPELKELLKAAAICGEVFWEGACEAAGHTEVARKLQALQAAELVSPRPASRITGTREWVFRHGLLHQVALGMLPPQPRRLHHLQLAAWLEGVGEQDAALLAHHYKAGGDAARAARYTALAGERALSDGDAHTAVTCFMSALSMDGAAAPSRAARAGQLLGLARSLLQVNRYDEAIQQLQQLEALAPEADAAVDPAQLRYLQGRTLLGQGDYARAETTLQGALDLDVHEALGFKIRQTLFWVIWVQGRYRDAGPLAEALFAEAEADDQQCAAKLCLSYWENVEGDLSRAVVLAAEAVAHARAVSHPFREMDALMLLGAVREAAGQYDAALEALAQAQSLAVRLRTAHQQAGVLGLQARIQLTLGALEPALELGAAAIGTAETLGDKRLLVDALVTEARSLSRPGARQDLDGALERAERALALARDNAPTTEAEAELALAEVFLARGDSVQAAASARAAVALLDQLGTQERYEIEILLAGHDALQAAGDDDAAAELLQRAAAALQRRSTRIGAEGVRASFLGEVPYNRRVEALRASGSGCS